MKITIFISLLVAAYAAVSDECDNYGNDDLGVWYWEQGTDADTGDAVCKLVYCIRQQETDNNGGITYYGVKEYDNVPDYWKIKDKCEGEDESGRGFACAESDLIYPDTCGCPSCPTCEKSMDNCPNAEPTFITTVYANDETCEIDYSPCCKDQCDDGSYIYGQLNDAMTECVYEASETCPEVVTTVKPETTKICDEFACPEGTPNKGWVLDPADADCNYNKDDCCLNECSTVNREISGTFTMNNDGSYTCIYDDANICPETTKAGCDVEWEYCPDTVPGVKAYVNDNCEIDYTDCCPCENGADAYGSLNDAMTECIYETDACTKTETTAVSGCSDDKYICCNGYKKSECYVDSYIDVNTDCAWQFEEYDSLSCTDETFECPSDDTTMVTEISRNYCCKFMHDECCIIECEEATYYGYFSEYDDGTITCKYKNDNWEYIDTPTCDTDPEKSTEAPETTKDSECDDDGKAVCCNGMKYDGKCAAEEACDAEWDYAANTFCIQSIFECPDNAEIDGLTYSSENCCVIEEDDCCVRTCESEDGKTAEMRGEYMSDDSGTYCAWEYECNACPLDDAKECVNGGSISRNLACEFDLDECCEEEENCEAVGYLNDDGTVSCKYECKTESTEEPEKTTDKPSETESTDETTTFGGGFSGCEMMHIFTAIAFVFGVFGWM